MICRLLHTHFTSLSPNGGPSHMIIESLQGFGEGLILQTCDDRYRHRVATGSEERGEMLRKEHMIE